MSSVDQTKWLYFQHILECLCIRCIVTCMRSCIQSYMHTYIALTYTYTYLHVNMPMYVCMYVHYMPAYINSHNTANFHRSVLNCIVYRIVLPLLLFRCSWPLRFAGRLIWHNCTTS